MALQELLGCSTSNYRDLSKIQFATARERATDGVEGKGMLS